MGSFDTFGDLQDRVKDGLADHTDTFFSPTEVKAALNEGMWEIYKILHSENRGYFFNTIPETISLTPNTNYYDLTENFGWVDEMMPVNNPDRSIRFYYKSRHDQEFRDLLNASTDDYYTNENDYFFDVIAEKTLVVAPRVSSTMSVYVYIVQDPAEMETDGETPPLKVLWRPLVIEYAVRKLKGKEETGEYLSHDKLLIFLLGNLSKYAGPRAGTNALTVEDFQG